MLMTSDAWEISRERQKGNTWLPRSENGDKWPHIKQKIMRVTLDETRGERLAYWLQMRGVWQCRAVESGLEPLLHLGPEAAKAWLEAKGLVATWSEAVPACCQDGYEFPEECEGRWTLRDMAGRGELDESMFE